MKPYYQVWAKDDDFMTIHIAKASALQERIRMQDHGYVQVYIKKIKGRRSISDFS